VDPRAASAGLPKAFASATACSPIDDGKSQAAVVGGRLSKGPTGYPEIGCETLALCLRKGDLISLTRFGRGGAEEAHLDGYSPRARLNIVTHHRVGGAAQRSCVPLLEVD
jgi:hypothetical protein